MEPNVAHAAASFFQFGSSYRGGVLLTAEAAKQELASGILAWRKGRRDRAFAHLQQAVHLDPQSAQAHEWMGQWFASEGMVEQAFHHSSIARKLEPSDQGIQISHACVLEVAGNLDEAWKLAEQLKVNGCVRPRLVSLYGRMARFRPRGSQALALVEQTLHVSNLSPADRVGLHFAAAGLLDQLGRYDEAFAHAVEANRLSDPAPGPQLMEQGVQRLIDYFKRPRLRSLSRPNDRSEVPVFLVGMPRCGSSLIEQILASHPNIHGAGELDFMHRIAYGAIDMLKCGTEQYPSCLDRLTPDQADGLAQVYIEPLRAMNPEALRIIDKMLPNFLHLGLISILLPAARVIHCQRDPMDTCASCFLTHFTTGHEFTHELQALGLYYREYERLMAHWKQTLDVPILDVKYEDVVDDPEGQTRRMLDFLGLPWNSSCLRFFENRRPVVTASVQQVRQPIYRDSIGRAHHYEKYLAPLRQALSESQ